jgi:hypothetical protein
MRSFCNPTHFRHLSRRGFLEVGTLGALSGLGADPAIQGFEVRDVSLPKGGSDEDSLRFQEMRSAMEAHFSRAETNGTALDTMDEFYKKA